VPVQTFHAKSRPLKKFSIHKIPDFSMSKAALTKRRYHEVSKILLTSPKWVGKYAEIFASDWQNH
jgi:hypothetical protein